MEPWLIVLIVLSLLFILGITIVIVYFVNKIIKQKEKFKNEELELKKKELEIREKELNNKKEK